MYMNNNNGGGAGGAGSNGAAANLPNFASPFLDHMSLGQMSMDFPTRHLSPNMGSARLPYQSMPPSQQQQSQQQQQQQNMFAPVNGNNQGERGSQQQAFDPEKAKQKIMSVTNNLANLERFSHMDKSKNTNSSNSSQASSHSDPNGDNNSFHQQQQGQGGTPDQTPSMVAPPGSQILGSGYFGSPLLSNTMDYVSRRLTPPTTNAILSAILPPDTPAQQPATMAPIDDVKLKKSAAVVSNLMNAERLSQNHRRKDTESGSSSAASSSGMTSATGGGSKSAMSTPRLFAPLDQATMMRPPQQGQQQPSAAPTPLMTGNMIRGSRLSADGDDYLNWGMADFGYTFSPGEMVRSLGPAGSIPESPMAASMRMFPYGAAAPPPPAYGAMMAQHPWQYQQLPPQQQQTPRFPPSALTQYHQHPLAHHAGASSAKKRSKKDLEDEGGASKKKKKSSPAKEEDPNEPRITSKHRGVCWYKRTKKWVVQTKVNGKRVHVGYFDDEEKAAEAYKAAVQGIQVKKALEAKQKSLEARANAGADQPTV